VHGRALIAAAVLTVAGCGPAQEAAAPSHTVRLLVRDSNLRPVGVDCAGSGPFLAYHRTARFRVLDGAGETVGEGTLPAGTSVQALKEDLEVERVPTFCRFEFGVDVRERGTYQLAVDGRDPIPLTRKGASLVAVVP
jgi:hypothetical protein